MNHRTFSLLLKSIIRRKKDFKRSCIAVFFAMFFVTGILLLQSNIYEWQMALNKTRFGNWFVVETSVKNEPTKKLTDNGKLNMPVVAASSVKVYDVIADTNNNNEYWRAKSNSTIGYFTQDFIDKTGIKLDKGHWPDNDNQVVMDYNTLIEHGYDLTLGQTITVNYYLNDSNGSYSNERTEEFELCGILNNYSNTWANGSVLPNYIVNQNKAESINKQQTYYYCYVLDTMVTINDYSELYDELCKESGRKLIYNSNVYDFKPWGSPFVYNYMFIIVMIIGIVAIVYQMWCYQRKRINTYFMMRKNGATKLIINGFISFENYIIIITFGFLGIIASLFAGRFICGILEKKTKILFYTITWDVYYKSLLSVIIAIIVVELLKYIVIIRNVERLFCINSKAGLSNKNNTNLNKSNDKSSYRHSISEKHTIFTIYRRLHKNNGFGQNIGVRLLTLLITIIIIVCIFNITSAYRAYYINENSPDMIGVVKFDVNDFFYIPYNYFLYENFKEDLTEEEIYWNSKNIANVSEIKSKEYYEFIKKNKADISAEQYYDMYIDAIKNGFYYGQKYNDKKMYVSNQIFSLNDSHYVKSMDTSLYRGFNIADIEEINSIPGVKSTTLYSFDSSRAWYWEGQDIEKMGGSNLIYHGKGTKDAQYGNRYIYASEYITPNKDLYNRLLKYIDEEYIDYDAFCRGEQVVVFIQESSNGQLDDSIKSGTEISLGYNLNHFMYTPTIYTDNKRRDEAYDKMSVLYPFISDYKKILDEQAYNNNDTFLDEEEKYNQKKQWLDIKFKNIVGGAAKVKACAVIYADDSIKKEFEDIIPEFAQYTALGSIKIAEKLVDSQNEYMKEILNYYNAELTNEALGKIECNQINIVFDLSSTYSSTENILKKTFKQNNVSYNSNSINKDSLRIKTLNAIMQFGFTLIAALFIDLIIYLIIIKNRISARIAEYRMLKRLGFGNARLIKVIMLETVYESLWCLFTLPIKFLICLFIAVFEINKLERN